MPVEVPSWFTAKRARTITTELYWQDTPSNGNTAIQRH